MYSFCAIKQNTSSRFKLLVLFLLNVTVSLGGEEHVSISPTSQTVVSSHLASRPRHINVTQSFIHQLTLSSPSSSPPAALPPVVLPVAWPIAHPDTKQPDYGNDDDDDDEEPTSSSTPPPSSSTSSGLDQASLFNPTPPSSSSANNASATPTKKRTNRKLFCSRTYAYLDKCLAHIPPIPDTGIPSTASAVEAACRAFNQGMLCVDEWTSKCLPKDKIAKFKASISGAHETFTFLCRDHKFRNEFLSHGNCYKKISYQWDECSKHFINSMKRFHSENSTIQCCVRLSFLQCVSEISHYHCNREAAKFLQKMAETLVRATMRTHLPPTAWGSTSETAPSSALLLPHSQSQSQQ